MNKKNLLYLAGPLLILAILYITAAYGYGWDKPATVTTASIEPAPPAASENDMQSQVDAIAGPTQEPAQVKEPAGIEAPAVKPVEQPEATTKAASKPAVQNPHNPNSPTPQNSTAAAQSDVPVSRAIPTDTSQYPLVSKSNGSYGQFHYRNLSGGRIEIDPQWVKANIVTITLPGLNRSVQVHRKAADNFIKAFTLIKNGTAVVDGRTVSLLSLVKTMDGTWVPRHVNWNSSRGLSNHSWGTAIDINAANHFRYVNPATERNDPNLILWEKAFQPAGFSWGNSYADSMHYELLD